jgi:hypothetical protein
MKRLGNLARFALFANGVIFMFWLAGVNGNVVWSTLGALFTPPFWFSLSRWLMKSFWPHELDLPDFSGLRTERTFETGANGASRLWGQGNREWSEHGFKRPLGAPPYGFGQNAAICLAGC